MDRLRELDLLQGLPDDHLAWLCQHGDCVVLAQGEHMFERGDPADSMWIVAEGVIQGFEEHGNQWLLVATTHPGEVTGMLPFSRMTHYPRLTVAAEDSMVLRIDVALFPEMLSVSPELGRRLVAQMSDRVRSDVRLEQQSEKMMALGRLSAGLAPELNYTASGVRRGWPRPCSQAAAKRPSPSRAKAPILRSARDAVPIVVPVSVSMRKRSACSSWPPSRRRTSTRASRPRW